MHKELLLQAFDKVYGELVKEGVKTPSPNRCATRLSEIISEDFAYGERSLRDYYREAKSISEGDIEIPQPQVILALAKYIGYETYEEFILKNKGKLYFKIEDGVDRNVELISPTDDTLQKKVKKGINPFAKGIRSKKGLAFTAVLISAITIATYLYIDRQKWMVWNGNHYEIIPFDTEMEKNGVLNLYDEDNFLHLKKIVPSCNTQFFNADGSERIWYGKNRKKEYEFFTSLGKHPETGKTLKPITKYMIEKYLCP